MKKQATLALLALVSLVSQLHAQDRNPMRLECEVLEISNPYRGESKDLSAIGYALVRHKNQADRRRLSEWLRTESGADVVFTAGDGSPHRGALRRLRMCFGRGLLMFTEPVKLREGDVLIIDFHPSKIDHK